MMLSLHNRAIVRHWSEDNGEGDDDSGDPGKDRGQLGTTCGAGGTLWGDARHHLSLAGADQL